MKISIQLIAGLALTLLSAYYWGTVGNTAPLSDVPVFYRYTYRFYPYLDIVLTFVGMLLFYRGLKRLKQ
jgi:hypothetical protein